MYMKKILTLFMAALISVGMMANTKRVYCKMTYSWWTTDGAAVAVHYWGGSADGTSWPGIRMTAVVGDEGVWSYDVPADVTGLMFVRVNGSGSVTDWGAKTANLTLPADDKNLYTITSSTAVWGDPGVAGAWSKYSESEDPEPVVHTYTVAGGSTELLGSAWSTTDENNDMELVDGLYVWSKADVTLPKTEVLFKVVKDHDWNKGSWPASNYELNIAKSGVYDVTITFNASTGAITATATLKKEEIVLPIIAFASKEYNAWSTTADVLVNASDSLSASKTIHIETEGDYEFKIVKDGNWLSLNGEGESLYTFHRTYTAAANINGVDLRNMLLKADKAGDYTIKWVYANDSLCFIFPELLSGLSFRAA